MDSKCFSLVIVLLVTALVELVIATPKYACDPSVLQSLGLKTTDLPFCDSSLAWSARALDLVGRLTLKEKVNQTGDSAYGIPRLGVPPYEWWSEALHGVSNVGPGTVFDSIVPAATSFPTVILTTASFNETLWKTIGEAVSTEARAMHNVGTAGLTFWSPNINVVRDPRWGRTLETPGEDPFVVGRYATNYVRGLQDTGTNTLKVSSCCKHYTAYDLDNWKGIDRLHFDAKPTQQDLLDTFQPPFETCVKDGRVSSVMCSYNRINGIPSCADPELLKGTVRGEWKLEGYIVSDCDSIEVIVDDNKYAKSPEEAVAYTLRSGLDLNCGIFYPKYLESAVLQGLVKESDIDNALVNLYIVLIRLGFFDGSIKKYANLCSTDICTAGNQELAVEAAREGIVLLKNDGSLPLSPASVKNVAVIGPHANATKAMIGNYEGIPCKYTSPLQGLQKYSGIVYQPGCSDVHCNNSSMIASAVEASKNADASILVVGLDLSVEAESLDRDDLLLPGYQTDLVNQVAKNSKGPVILVIMAAGAVDISFAQNSDKISGILWVGYPGQGGGDAIAQVIFGSYNPGGRLPLTWYPNQYVESLNYTDMHMRSNASSGYPGRTYRFYAGKTLYPFGHGLSYTIFKYSLKSIAPQKLRLKVAKNQLCHSLYQAVNASISPCPSIRLDESSTVCRFSNIKLEIEVSNKGHRDGSEVVLVYAVPPKGLGGAPRKHLIAFRRVFVKAGQSKIVPFIINACDSLSLIDNSAYKVLVGGRHKLVVGDLHIPLQISLLPYS